MVRSSREPISPEETPLVWGQPQPASRGRRFPEILPSHAGLIPRIPRPWPPSSPLPRVVKVDQESTPSCSALRTAPHCPHVLCLPLLKPDSIPPAHGQPHTTALLQRQQRLPTSDQQARLIAFNIYDILPDATRPDCLSNWYYSRTRSYSIFRRRKSKETRQHG